MRLAGSWLKDGNRARGIAGTKTKKKGQIKKLKSVPRLQIGIHWDPHCFLSPKISMSNHRTSNQSFKAAEFGLAIRKKNLNRS